MSSDELSIDESDFIKTCPTTHKGRLERIKVLEEYIAKRGTVEKRELHRLGLTDPRLNVSIRVMDDYLYQLAVLGKIEVYDIAVKWIDSTETPKKSKQKREE